MKKTNLSKALVAAMAVGMSMSAAGGDPHGVNVHFKVKPSGSRADFETTVTVDYPQGVSLQRIDGALHDAGSLNAMSSIVTKVEITAGDAQGYYTVKTRGTTEVMGVDVHKWTHSRCKTARAEGTFTQTCEMVLSGGNTREFFDHGGSRNICTESSGRVRCTHQGWGRVKEVSKFGVTIRTAPRLAIGGASQLIADFSTLALILNNTMFPSSAVERTDAWTLKERLYNEGRSYIENDHLSAGRKMVITGSNGGAFSLREE